MHVMPSYIMSCDIMLLHYPSGNLNMPSMMTPNPDNSCTKSSPVGIQRSTGVGAAKLEGSKEVVQELVVLALPPVPIKEGADPGDHALEKEDRQCPDERQGDSLKVG